MNHLNSVLIEGYLLTDPVFKTAGDGPDKGKRLCQFIIASNRYKGNAEPEKEVTTVHIEALGKVAEACGNQGKKGRRIRVVGRLKQKYWKMENNVSVLSSLPSISSSYPKFPAIQRLNKRRQKHDKFGRRYCHLFSKTKI